MKVGEKYIIQLIARVIINENLISSLGSYKVYLIYQNDSAMLEEWIYEAIAIEQRRRSLRKIQFSPVVKYPVLKIIAQPYNTLTEEYPILTVV